MMFDRKAFLLATAAIAVLAGPAAAQTANTAGGAVQNGSTPQGEQPDGEIIVTAQKRQQRLIDVPQSISVLSADALAQTHSQRLDDFFTRIPSASINEAQAGDARIILRGINTGGVSATVATYVDETPYGSATSLANGAVLAPDLDPADLDRVEVLRGPQGTLYGANSLGGLVKYVTKLPSTDALHGSVETGVEAVEGGNVGYFGRVMLNVPVTSTLAVRASGFYRQDPGYIDDVRFGHNINTDQTYGGRVSALWKPTDRFTLRGTAFLENLDSNGSNVEDVNLQTLKPTYGDLTQSRGVRTPNYIQYRVYNITGTYDFGPVSLISSTSWGNLDQNAVEDATGLYGGLLFAFAPLLGVTLPPNTTALAVPLSQRLLQRRFTEEVRLSSSNHGFFEWTVGGFYTRERNDLSQNLAAVDFDTGAAIPGYGSVANVNLASRYREYAGFADGTFHFTHQLSLTLGGRYSHNEQSALQLSSGPLGGPTAGGSSSDDVFTYSVAPEYKPMENVTLYARVAKGYRPGGPNVLPPAAAAGASAVPAQFGADTTINYEVGVKSELFNRKVSIDATAFDIDWSKIQLLTVVGGFGVNINGGSARSRGFELSASWRPVTGLVLAYNASYIDAYLTQDAPAVVGGFRGDRLPYTADYQSTVSADYERPLSGTVTGTAGLSWRYTGPRVGAFDPSPAFGQRRLGAFSQLDVHAGVTFSGIKLDGFIRNLTNDRGVLDLGTSQTPELNGSIGEAIVRPRSYGLSLGYAF